MRSRVLLRAAAFVLVSFGLGVGVARAKDPFGPDGGPIEKTAGPWKAWVVVTGNPMARALRGTAALFRRGPNDAAPQLLWHSARPFAPRFELHESGLLLLAEGRGSGVRAFAGGSTEAVDRPDVGLLGPSRFLRDGLLSFSRTASGDEPPGIDVAWIPTTVASSGMTLLGPRWEVARVRDAVSALDAERATLALLEEKTETFVAWSIPVAGGSRLGAARLKHADPSAATLLLDRAVSPAAAVIGLSRTADGLRLDAGALEIDLDPSGPAAAPSPSTAVLDVLCDRLVTTNDATMMRALAEEVRAARGPGRDALARRLHRVPLDEPPWDRLAVHARDLVHEVLPAWWALEAPPTAGDGAPESRRRTRAIGGRAGDAFEEIPTCLAPIVGLRVTSADLAGHRVIASVQALYRCAGEVVPGKTFGRPHGVPAELRGPAGHVLGALFVRGGTRLDGLRPVWLRMHANDALDSDGMVLGPWYGGHGGREVVRLGSGLLMVGIHGRHGAEIDALGVVERVPGPTPPGPTVRVAAIQSPSELGDVEANRDRLARLVEEAAANGAKIVVLPEAAVTGYLSQDLRTTWHVPGRPRAAAFPSGRDPALAAEPVPGPSTDRFSALARRLSIWLTVPLVEVVRPTASDGPTRYFNTVVLLSPKGEVAGHYRKVNPWPHPEQSWADEGDRGLVVVETEYGPVGLAICYDVHEVFPGYAWKGIWTLLYSVAWVSAGDDEKWFGHELPLRVRAAGFHVIAANWSVERPQPWHGAGYSRVISSRGAVLARAKAAVGEEIVYAELPRAQR